MSQHENIHGPTTDKLRPIQMNFNPTETAPSSTPSKLARGDFASRRNSGRHSVAERTTNSTSRRPDDASEAVFIIENSKKQTTSRLLRVAAKTATANVEEDYSKRQGDRRLAASADDEDAKSYTSTRSSSSYYKSRGRFERFQQIRQKKQMRSRAGSAAKNQETASHSVSTELFAATGTSPQNVARSQFRRRFLLRDSALSPDNGPAVDTCPDLPHDISSVSHSTDPSFESADIENADSYLSQPLQDTVENTEPGTAVSHRPPTAEDTRTSAEISSKGDREKDLPSYSAARRRFALERRYQRNSGTNAATILRSQDPASEDDGSASQAPSSSFDLAMQRFGGSASGRRRLVPQAIDREDNSSGLQHPQDRQHPQDGGGIPLSKPVLISTRNSGSPSWPANREDYGANTNNTVMSKGDHGAPRIGRIANRNYLEDTPRRRTRYYRIVFHGVVALLSKPHPDAPKSGAYVSYGEIVSTQQPVLEVPMNTSFRREDHSTLATKSEAQPPSPSCPSIAHSHYSGLSLTSSRATSSTAPSSHSGDTKLEDDCMVAVRVDDVLTGGYAVDASTPGGLPRHPGDSITPRRTNKSGVDLTRHEDGQSVGERSEVESQTSDKHYGFLFLRRKNVAIAEELPSSVPPPVCEAGPFTYVVASTNPQPILTGPSLDAPRTPAVVLPGSVHVVSLRVRTSQSLSRPHHGIRDDESETEIFFLRLNHRRGWVADRRTVSNVARRGESPPRATVLMREVSAADNNGREVRSSDSVSDEVSVGTMSQSSCSVATSVSVARIRRPPLRRRRFEEARRGTDTGYRPPSRPRGRSGNSIVSSDDAPLSPTGTSPGAGSVTDREFDTSLVSPYHENARADRGHEFPSSPISNLSLLSDDSMNRVGGGRAELRLQPRPVVDRWSEKMNVPPPRKATRFLMRVTAPDGLKILDAPHFQVNNLVRKHASPLRQRLRDGGATYQHTALPKHPSSIFHTMTGSFGAHETSHRRFQPSMSTDSAGKMRLLHRGSFFEASRRMEATALYTQGAGLIKLADNSGWAIVPLKENLDQQYRHFRVAAAADVKEGEALRAYEEVGNAVSVGEEAPTSANQPQTPTLWMRVMSRGGAIIEAAPTRLRVSASNEESEAKSGHATGTVSRCSSAEENAITHGNDTEVASSAGSSILDAVFRSQSFEGRPDSLKIPRSPRRRMTDKQQHHEVNKPTLPCGMCVEVEEWEDKENTNALTPHESQSYVRLAGGHGWIPRHLQGEVCAIETERPLFRNGSFWYRVSYRRGVKVRNGPSRRAHSIKSASSEGEDGKYFRFECGEFLRASDVMTTVAASVSKSEGIADATPEPVETWVKLYRRHNAYLRLPPNPNGSNWESLVSGPSEWVQAFSNGKMYLEECFEAPKIERRREGWRYKVVSEDGVKVQRGPSFDADATNRLLSSGEGVSVNERITAAGDRVTWLRLKDGSGWVPQADMNGETVVVAQSLGMRTKAVGMRDVNNDDNASDADRSPAQSRAGSDASLSYNVLIARLFNGASSSSEIHRDSRTD